MRPRLICGWRARPAGIEARWRTRHRARHSGVLEATHLRGSALRCGERPSVQKGSSLRGQRSAPARTRCRRGRRRVVKRSKSRPEAGWHGSTAGPNCMPPAAAWRSNSLRHPARDGLGWLVEPGVDSGDAVAHERGLITGSVLGVASSGAAKGASRMAPSRVGFREPRYAPRTSRHRPAWSQSLEMTVTSRFSAPWPEGC